MALAATPMIPLGFHAPDFTLINVADNQPFSLYSKSQSKGTVIIFMCNHCPYVIHVIKEITAISNNYIEKGIDFIGINSNDIERYPDDSPENMKKLIQQYGLAFPYLFDESQEVAKSYQAACTPEFNVFDKELNCVYRGQLDGSRPGNQIPVNGNDLRNALDSLIAGTSISSNQIPSTGCSIKWKPGNQP